MNASTLKYATPIRRSRRAIGRAGLALAVPALILIIWQLAGQSPDMAGVVPTPVQVARAWYAWIFGSPGMRLNPYQGTWAGNVQYSAMRVLQGFALAMLLGIPLGLTIGWSRLASQTLDPLIQGLRPIPITAWLPFSIALFGIRDMGSIFLIFLPILIPIARQFGWDLTWFGVVLTMNIAIGSFTPPMAVNLMITSKVSGCTIESTVPWVIWFVLSMTAAMLLVIFVPELALFLPRLSGAL